MVNRVAHVTWEITTVDDDVFEMTAELLKVSIGYTVTGGEFGKRWYLTKREAYRDFSERAQFLRDYLEYGAN